jgi:acetoin utilization protein AcuC
LAVLAERDVIAVQQPTRPRGSAPRPTATFIGSSLARSPAFGSLHPLAIPRVAAVMDLCAVLGWLGEADFRESPEAGLDTLARFHDRAYVAALHHAEAVHEVDSVVRERYHLGNFENPLFPGVFRKAATAVGGSILAAELALEGQLTFHPAGGTHHGRRDRASGFCYFNDPVFAILTLLDRGVERVAYVDLDAHHCDGVQDAFRPDPRVATMSIHERGRWPGTGAADDRGGGRSVNLPVPPQLNDDEFDFLLHEALIPAVDRFRPGAIVVTCGTDALAGDPLAGMALSNLALWDAVESLCRLAPVRVVLGGGGYNPWTLARCWTGLWGRLRGCEPPPALPAEASAILSALRCDLVDDEDVRPEWLTTLADTPNHGSIRQEVRSLARGVVAPAPGSGTEARFR